MPDNLLGGKHTLALIGLLVRLLRRSFLIFLSRQLIDYRGITPDGVALAQHY